LLFELLLQFCMETHHYLFAVLLILGLECFVLSFELLHDCQVLFLSYAHLPIYILPDNFYKMQTTKLLLIIDSKNC
jgi:hypothetical protein